MTVRTHPGLHKDVAYRLAVDGELKSASRGVIFFGIAATAGRGLNIAFSSSSGGDLRNFGTVRFVACPREGDGTYECLATTGRARFAFVRVGLGLHCAGAGYTRNWRREGERLAEG